MGRLFKRCLRKDPQLRFQRFGEIYCLLEKMAHSHDQNPSGEFGLFTRNGKRNASILGIALAATAAALWWRGGSTGEPAVIGGRIRQITETSGYDTEPTFSRDGSQLAYTSDRDGGGILHIWTQPAAAAKPAHSLAVRPTTTSRPSLPTAKRSRSAPSATAAGST